MCAHSLPFLEAMPGDRIQASWPLPGSFHDLARLGALHGAVWDDLGQLNNPVVNLVAAAALHCGASRGHGDSGRTHQRPQGKIT